MKILIIGKSAREQVLIEHIKNSKRLSELYCIPGNPAIANHANCINIPLDDLTSIIEFAKENKIDLTISLDEYTIQNGIANLFKQENLKIFAPTMESAQIATSRAFAKKFLYKNKIPTPKFGTFDKENSAIDFLKKTNFPIVIKYDHLANLDSFICNSFTKAKTTITKVFEEVQKKVVIEEYLDGEHITLSILTDGYNVLPLPYVREYKRTLSGEGGHLTKGVGAFTPYSKITNILENKIAKTIVFPLLDALQEAGIPYEGFLSISLLLLPNNEVKVLEFLPTLSIPEATCVIPLIEDDLLDIIYVAIEGALEDCYQNFSISPDAIVSACLMKGFYPNHNNDAYIVSGIENLDEDNIELYYNETGMNEYYEVVATGGRAFFMTARASTLKKARTDLYNNIDTIKFNQVTYRSDIAKINIRDNFLS